MDGRILHCCCHDCSFTARLGAHCSAMAFASPKGSTSVAADHERVRYNRAMEADAVLSSSAQAWSVSVEICVTRLDLRPHLRLTSESELQDDRASRLTFDVEQ